MRVDELGRMTSGSEPLKVVITGGAGFIGSNLTRYWCQTAPDDEVVVFDALTYAGHRESLVELEVLKRLTFVRGDIRNIEEVSPVVKGADLVLHLAAESHNDRAIVDPLAFVSSNVMGTAVLLEACRRGNVTRLHHVSTDEVFGSLDLDSPSRFTSESHYRPRGPYSASKAGSDHLVRAWHETYGLSTTISNSGNNFGPYQHPEKLIPLSIIRFISGRKMTVYGDGENVRDWIYVTDHCAALQLIARRGHAGATYLISAQNELANKEVVMAIAELAGVPGSQIEFVPDRAGHDRRYALTPSESLLDWGWKPATSFKSALRTTVEWYQSHSSWWGPLMPGPGHRVLDGKEGPDRLGGLGTRN